MALEAGEIVSELPVDDMDVERTSYVVCAALRQSVDTRCGSVLHESGRIRIDATVAYAGTPQRGLSVATDH